MAHIIFLLDRVLHLLYIYIHSYKEKKAGSFMLQWSTVCYFSLTKPLRELPLLVYIDPPFSFKLMQSTPYYQPGLIRPFSIDGQLGCSMFPCYNKHCCSLFFFFFLIYFFEIYFISVSFFFVFFFNPHISWLAGLSRVFQIAPHFFQSYWKA